MQNDLPPLTPFSLNFNGSGYSIAGNALGAQAINQLVSGTNQIFVPIAESVTGTITSLPVNVAAGGTLALNNSVVGSFSLIKSGAGRVILAGRKRDRGHHNGDRRKPHRERHQQSEHHPGARRSDRR